MPDPPTGDFPRRVAVYWDFENLVISNYDRTHRTFPRERVWKNDSEKGPLRRKLDRAKKAKIDLDALLSHAAAIGTVVVNRSYCDWTRPVFDEYGVEFADRCVELVHMFSRYAGKNGADIRMALDAVADLRRDDRITDVVVYSGDGDFVPVADHCRALGKRIHAVGIRGHANGLWRLSCRFRYYDQVAANPKPLSTARAATSADVDAVELLSDALSELPAGQWVASAALEPLMRRLKWAFDVSQSPHRTIEQLVDVSAAAGVVDVAPGRPASVRLRTSAITSAEPPSHTDAREPVLAVYWNFEDLVVSEYDRIYGSGAWLTDGVRAALEGLDRDGRIEQTRIAVAKVMKFAQGIGTVVSNRYYGDWSTKAFNDYCGTATELPPTEFMHLPTTPQLPVDIALPRDVLRDIERIPRITDVLVCSGAARFDGLPAACLTIGRRLHVLGSAVADDDTAWRTECDYRNYGDLVAPPPERPLDPWVRLLQQALAADGSRRVDSSVLKNRMRAINSAFSERDYNFKTFRPLLREAERIGIIALDLDDSNALWVRLAPSG